MSEGKKSDWFTSARYGMFIHYGLYSRLERGEWVMNRERIPRSEMMAMARHFDPSRFDAEALCDLALTGGMRYVNLTSMHHDGFCLYDTELTDFNSMHHCGRDLVAEFVKAARDRGLKVVLYHSLNNWTAQPDAVDALENKDAYEEFIEKTFARIRELVTRFNPIDILWYDGWWPFHADGWRSEKMNAMIQSIQPDIMFNGRNGLPGDFSTPEGHVTMPRPWRPWEACMTLNNHWGYHRGDQEWKSPLEVIGLLIKVAQGRGNLLLNVGPRGDGSVPEESARIIKAVGYWLRRNGESIFDTDFFTYDFMHRDNHKGDWALNGAFTLAGKSLYYIVRYWPGNEITIAGLDTDVESVHMLSESGPTSCAFSQENGRVIVSGLPDESPDPLCAVLRFDCAEVPSIYLTAGMRVPKVDHAPYDPCPSDLAQP